MRKELAAAFKEKGNGRVVTGKRVVGHSERKKLFLFLFVFFKGKKRKRISVNARLLGAVRLLDAS